MERGTWGFTTGGSIAEESNIAQSADISQLALELDMKGPGQPFMVLHTV